MDGVLVATTLAPYKTGRFSRTGAWPDECDWLESAEDLVKETSQPVEFFAALETDGRGMAPYAWLQRRILDAGVKFSAWSFALDTGVEEINSYERLHRICTGRNHVAEYAHRRRFEWILFLDSDMRVPGASVEKLLEMRWPIVGGEVPNYCLAGEVVTDSSEMTEDEQWGTTYNFPVQAHWNTAGFLMVHHSLFTRLRWRAEYVGEREMTDDPCYAADAAMLGYPTLVRKDLIGEHEPLVGVELRGHDLALR